MSVHWAPQLETPWSKTWVYWYGDKAPWHFGALFVDKYFQHIAQNKAKLRGKRWKGMR